MEILKEADLEQSPVETAHRIHMMIAGEMGVEDPYQAIKRECNDAVLAEMEFLSKWLGEPDSIDYALRYAVAGNTIDYGIQHDFDLGKVAAMAMKNAVAVDDSSLLKNELGQARKIAYVLDNAGEIVFDRILIETINQLYQPEQILAVVRDRPFINDALLHDAKVAGLTSISNVKIRAMFPRIPTERDASIKVWKEVQSCDVIIAKGQANYEAFSEVKGMYFLFLIKCEQVRKEISKQSKRDALVGEMVVWKSEK